MASANRVFAFCFLALCLFKAVGPIQESSHHWYEAAPMAFLFAAMFGSPQLAWAVTCHNAQLSGKQVFVALLTAVAFLCTSLIFGTLPGVGRPNWGGEGHFEVPVALAVEWLIAGGMLVAFRTARGIK